MDELLNKQESIKDFCSNGYDGVRFYEINPGFYLGHDDYFMH